MNRLGFVLLVSLVLYPQKTQAQNEFKIVASDGAIWDDFGFSVAIHGSYAVVGSLLDDDKGTDSGSAYVYKWEGTSWVEVSKIIASDGDINDSFGEAVAIIGDYILVGAAGDDDQGLNTGSVYVFQQQETGWREISKLRSMIRKYSAPLGDLLRPVATMPSLEQEARQVALPMHSNNKMKPGLIWAN